ncbi:unnamed protein product [Amoebophrya sp. A120]|nr:unnamed protein product [Amoebophrya sp. A120]|eukprot:GSA120T00024752001.1
MRRLFNLGGGNNRDEEQAGDPLGGRPQAAPGVQAPRRKSSDSNSESGVSLPKEKSAMTTASSSSSSSMAEFRDVKQVVRQQVPETAGTVLLGECTHGTEEFYRLRAEITKFLIEVRGFKVVIVEADWPFMWHVNQYIHRKKVKMFPDTVRFPDWMWRNQPFVELIEWMRKMSQTEHACYLFGMDCYCKEESQADLLRFLDNHDPELSRELRSSCFPRDRADKWPGILAKIQWGRTGNNKMSSGTAATSRTSNKSNNKPGDVIAGSDLTRDLVYPGASKLDRFNAEQNLECMIAADEYYTKQRLEPPGSQASWNARDQHMATTILRLKEQAKETFDLQSELKIVVWAHNSHVGDATATPSGGVNFERNETWNLGQMCRSVMQNVFIVGFYSYQGEVRAATEWGRPGKVMQLRPAYGNSLEAQLHNLFPKRKAFVKFDTSAKDWYKAPPTFQLPCDYELVYPEVHCTENADYKSRRISLTSSSTSSNKTASGLFSFSATERVVDRRMDSCRLQADFKNGNINKLCYVDEYTGGRNISVHSLPTEVFRRLRADPLNWFNTTPILQRWVGVQYHPETELQSHYGEVRANKCYDLVIFCDETTALDVNLRPVAHTGEDKEEVSAAAQKRLMKEYAKLLKDPPQGVEAHPLEDNILEWHFRLTGNQAPYTGGRYHGVLEFPSSFPMQPPSIRMLTPSGRFEINKRICLSMSDFHAESWNPSWTVEKILVGLLSFMYEETSESIGSMLDPWDVRKRYARESEFFNRENEVYLSIFKAVDDSTVAGSSSSSATGNKRQRMLSGGAANEYDENDDQPQCRYCLSGEGELVAPCDCKGTNQYVHLQCLRQWQKSVLLTQSTHPKFQTRIDAICNICEKPFKGPFRPKDRAQAVLEFAGAEMAQKLKKGHLLVSSEKESQESAEAMERQPELRPHLEQWTYAVYLIASEEPASRREDGHVLGVNLVAMANPEPPQRVDSNLPGFRRLTVSPMNAWKQSYRKLVEKQPFVRKISHYNGGPVEPDKCFALANLPSLTKTKYKESSLNIRDDMYFGNLASIANLAQLHYDNTREASHLRIYWGYAAWGTSQLLAEIAKRHWGINTEPYEFEPLPVWDDAVVNISMAKESEYSKK